MINYYEKMPSKGYPITNKQIEMTIFYAIRNMKKYMEILDNILEEINLSPILIYTENKTLNKLLGMFDRFIYKLLQSGANEKVLIDGFQKIRQHIIKYNAYKELGYLYYILNERAICSQEAKNNVYRIYISLIMEFISYIYLGRKPVYFDSETGELYLTKYDKSVFDDFDALYNYRDFSDLITLDKLISNVGVHEAQLDISVIMSHLLTERDSVIFDCDHIGKVVHSIVMEQWMDNDFFTDCLQYRKRLLPTIGITYKIDGIPQYDTLTLKEKIFNDGNIFLLFRLTDIDKKSIIGIYHVNTHYFNSILNKPNSNKDTFDNLIGLVLGAYTVLTCEFTIKKRRKAIYIYDSYEEFKKAGKYDSQVSLYLPEKIKKTTSQEKKTTVKDSLGNASTLIQPYIRGLPVGYVASEEAIENAKMFGITLSPGETFVTGFERQYQVKG